MDYLNEKVPVYLNEIDKNLIALLKNTCHDITGQYPLEIAEDKGKVYTWPYASEAYNTLYSIKINNTLLCVFKGQKTHFLSIAEETPSYAELHSLQFFPIRAGFYDDQIRSLAQKAAQP